MLLFVSEGCGFCETVKSRFPQAMVFTSVATPEGYRFQAESGDVIDPPVFLPGVPALLDGSKLFVGRNPILAHLDTREPVTV